ncbi:MAG: helix-turn-helix transcriptional regulator [Betaproteobacteria bacterium]|nr:helix-turn-helix transcriptional regulator [Betaproteobacteria bacterium]
MSGNADTQIVRRTLFDGPLLAVGHVIARPVSSACGEIERPGLNILVLPVAGVFGMHESSRRHVIATPNHAVFLSAGSPYRFSFPGRIGDECLTLRWSGAELACVLPEAVSRDGFDSSAFASHALLPPAVMLARSLLWRRFVRGENDPLAVEELGIGLLVSTLCAARKAPAGGDRGAPRGANRQLRQIERVKEAISLSPERKWTLAELADLACVSPYHLAHVFRKEVGTSVYRYVLRSRLAKGLHLVLDSGIDLSAVALEAGFASHSHFTARFRSLFGVTPNELRHGASPAKAAELRKIVTAHPAANA